MKNSLASLILCLVTSAASAKMYVPIPYSYRVFSADKRFVYVMIAPCPPESDAGHADSEARMHAAATSADEVRSLRKKYKQSGMYRNDGSDDPLWTVDWYDDVLKTKVFIAADGDHVIRTARYANGIGDEVVAFFDRGKRVRGHALSAFFDRPEMFNERREKAVQDRKRKNPGGSGSTYYVPPSAWASDQRLDDESMRFELTTVEGARYTFDATGGEIVQVEPPELIGKPILYYFIAIIVFVSLCGALAAIGFLRSRRQASQG